MDIQWVQFMLHYTGHFLFSGLLAYLFFRDQWKKAWLLMLLTMLIDLDHLLATPMYDPMRCSIGFHLLHQWWAALAYLGLFFYKTTRIIGLGLLFHLLIDGLDCLWMTTNG